MNSFDFYSPTLFAFGDGKEKELGALIQRFGGSRVLMVTGGGSIHKNGAYDDVVSALHAANLPYVELNGIQANPLSGKVYEGIEMCRAQNIDFILAVGGGSVIDTAKAIGAGVPYDGDFWDFFCGSEPKLEVSLPVGVVLTIAAAGSEGSDSCVITHEDGNKKWSMQKSDIIRPKFSVLNPRYTYSLPPYQTACGAADMFAHIFERYFSPTPDVGLTDRLCEALMKTILDAAPKALKNPTDYAARADLMWTGMLAHNNSCGVGRVQDWGSHQLSHELSALYDCTHGAGLAVILPAWAQCAMQIDMARFAQFAVRVFDCEMNFTNPTETAQHGIEAMRNFFLSMGLPVTLEQIGARAQDIPAMIAHRAAKPSGFPFGGFMQVDEIGRATCRERVLR